MGKPLVAATALIFLLGAVGWVASNRWFDDSRATRVPTTPTAPNAAPRNVQVTVAEGVVERSGSDGAWKPIGVGQVLDDHDSIRTGSEGRATLDLGHLATVEVREQSAFTLQEIETAAARVRIDRGRVSAVVSPNGSLRVSVKDSDAVAEARDASFSVLAADGQATVATERGSVQFSAKAQRVDVAAGQQSTAQRDRPPSVPMVIPASLFLKVVQPKDTVQRVKEAVVKGTATPGALVRVNGVAVVTDDSGAFEANVALVDGKNAVRVEASDASGRQKREQLPDITVVSKDEAKTKWHKPDDKGGRVKW